MINLSKKQEELISNEIETTSKPKYKDYTLDESVDIYDEAIKKNLKKKDMLEKYNMSEYQYKKALSAIKKRNSSNAGEKI